MATGRRAFLLTGLAAAGGATGYFFWVRAGQTIDPRCDAGIQDARPRVGPMPHDPFDPRSLTVLSLLLDRLLPGDPEAGLPSASDAGVLDYIVRAAKEPGLTSIRMEILKLTRNFERLAKRGHQKSFADLTNEEQNGLIELVRSGEGRTGRFRPEEALRTTIRFALEGYLGHPHHGGNRDFVVWKALQIPMPRKRRALDDCMHWSEGKET